MKVKEGDKVKFLNNVGGGVVVKLLKNNLVQVRTPDNFEFPVLMDELVVIEDINYNYGVPEAKDPHEKKRIVKPVIVPEPIPEPEEPLEIEPLENSNEKETDEISIYCGFVPKDEDKAVDCDLDFYIINDSNYQIYINMLLPVGNQYESKKRGSLEANTKEFIETFKRDELNQLSVITFQCMYYKFGKFSIKKPQQFELKINPVRFFQSKYYKENDFFDEKAIVFTIYEESGMKEEVNNLTTKDIQKIIKQKEIISPKINQPQVFKKNIDPMTVTEEVDLHIQELVENEAGMSPKEILEVQMSVFERELFDAIDRKNKAVVFIHGVGNGTLKMEIRKALDTKYKHLRYQDASFQEYGYGATMVLLR